MSFTIQASNSSTIHVKETPSLYKSSTYLSQKDEADMLKTKAETTGTQQDERVYRNKRAEIEHMEAIANKDCNYRQAHY